MTLTMAWEKIILLLITAILALSSAQSSSEDADEQRAKQAEVISRVSSDIPKELKAVHATLNDVHAARNAFRVIQTHEEVRAQAAGPDRTQIGPKIEYMKRMAEDAKKHHAGHLHSGLHLTHQVGGEILTNDESLTRAHRDASLRYAQEPDGSKLKHLPKKVAHTLGEKAEGPHHMTAKAASAAVNAMKNLQHLRAREGFGEHEDTNVNNHLEKVAHKSKEMQALRAHRRPPP